MPALIYYEDIVPQAKIIGPSVIVDKTEMVEFAKIWDPVPIHVEETVGKAAFGRSYGSGPWPSAPPRH